jgi:hypothetical protein
MPLMAKIKLSRDSFALQVYIDKRCRSKAITPDRRGRCEEGIFYLIIQACCPGECCNHGDDNAMAVDFQISAITFTCRVGSE